MEWQSNCLFSTKPATMPQVTLSVPQEKLPILHDFLNVLGIDSKNLKNRFRKNGNDTLSSKTPKSNSFFKTYFGWEYFCNELEFE
jgi:hypothetical protein